MDPDTLGFGRQRFLQIVDIPEVTEQIDGMVKDLKKEKADDIKQKDYCVEELNNNERPQYMRFQCNAQLEA